MSIKAAKAILNNAVWPVAGADLAAVYEYLRHDSESSLDAAVWIKIACIDPAERDNAIEQLDRMVSRMRPKRNGPKMNRYTAASKALVSLRELAHAVTPP